MDNLVCQMHITTDTFKRGETRFSSHFWISNELNEDIDLKKNKSWVVIIGIKFQKLGQAQKVENC